MTTPFASLGTSAGGGPATIVSAASLISELVKVGADYSAFFKKANSYTCSVGPEPGEAWLLMHQSELTKLDSGQPQDLVLGIGEESVAIKNLAIVRATRVITGRSLDPDAIYLVNLMDARWFLKRTTINARYNLRQAGSPSGWCEDTLNSGTPWTFEEICEDIFNQFTSFGGFLAHPTWDAAKFHEIATTEDPENIRFEGVSAWDALAELCQQSGFFLRYNPLVGDIRIMKIGLSLDPDPGEAGDLHAGFGGGAGAASLLGSGSTKFPLSHDSTVRSSEDDLLADQEILLGAPLIPASINVVFRTNDSSSGGFCDINANHGWRHTINITAATIRAILTGDDYAYIDEAVAGTSININSTMFAQFDAATDTSPSNTTELTDMATQLATDFYESIETRPSGKISLHGYKKYIPGPYISEVTWREYGDGPKTIVTGSPSIVTIEPPEKVFTGGGGCDSQNAKIQWTIFGNPTGGSFTSSLKINGVAETITFQWDDDATDVDTALAAHSELAGTDVTVTGGPFPNATIEVEFVGTQALTNVALPTSNWGGLTGGSGIAVLTSLSQLGHA